MVVDTAGVGDAIRPVSNQRGRDTTFVHPMLIFPERRVAVVCPRLAVTFLRVRLTDITPVNQAVLMDLLRASSVVAHE